MDLVILLNYNIDAEDQLTGVPEEHMPARSLCLYNYALPFSASVKVCYEAQCCGPKTWCATKEQLEYIL